MIAKLVEREPETRLYVLARDKFAPEADQLLANLGAARHRARERLGDRVVGHLPATTRVRVHGPPDRGSRLAPDQPVVVSVGVIHSVTLTER